MGGSVKDSIESVLSQDSAITEVIVVDDGSTDDTEAILAAYLDKIIYIRKKNGGLSSARNTGIQVARGGYLVFLDADDILLPGKLKLQKYYLDEHIDCAAVFSDGYIYCEGNGVRTRISDQPNRRLFRNQPQSQLKRLLLIGHPWPIHCAMVRTTGTREIGGFDETLRAREDLDFWLRLAEHGSIRYIDGLVAQYNLRRNSLSRNSCTMHKTSCDLYSRIDKSDSFQKLPSCYRAKCFRAWAIEVGILHFGPWEKELRLSSFWAASAWALEPWQWKNILLVIILKTPFCVRLAQASLRMMN